MKYARNHACLGDACTWFTVSVFCGRKTHGLKSQSIWAPLNKTKMAISINSDQSKQVLGQSSVYNKKAA